MYNLKKFYLPLGFSLILLSIFTYFKPYYHNNSKSSFTENIQEKDNLTFYITSDIHFLHKNLTDNGEAFYKFNKSGDGKELEHINEIFDTFTEEVKTNKPDFLIISGDLTLNGEKQSHLDMSSKLQDIKNSGVSVYVIPGNHDINNPWARKFNEEKQLKTDYISKDDFSTIYNDFGYKDAISRDSYSLSYLIAPSNNLWLLMVDDNYYENNISLNYPEPNGHISKSTLKWINSCAKLAKEKGAKMVAVSHHNLLKHSDYVFEGFTMDNSDEVLKCFKSNNINLCFSGHIHFQSIKNYNDANYKLCEIATSSLAMYPQKYGIVKYEKDKSLSYNTACINMSNLKDSFKNSYINFIYNKNYNKLSFYGDYSDDEVKAMCEAICNIRLKYDYSLDDLSWEDIRSSKGFILLNTVDYSFIKHYIKLTLDGNELQNNSVYVNL